MSVQVTFWLAGVPAALMRIFEWQVAKSRFSLSISMSSSGTLEEKTQTFVDLPTGESINLRAHVHPHTQQPILSMSICHDSNH